MALQSLFFLPRDAGLSDCRCFRGIENAGSTHPVGSDLVVRWPVSGLLIRTVPSCMTMRIGSRSQSEWRLGLRSSSLRRRGGASSATSSLSPLIPCCWRAAGDGIQVRNGISAPTFKLGARSVRGSTRTPSLLSIKL